MERLVFNTPSRYGEGNGPSGPFVMFTLFFLGFLAIFSLGFVVWYLISPHSGERLARNLQDVVTSGEDAAELRERAFLFRDEEVLIP